MNMHKELKNWLQELKDEVVIVTSQDISEEAHNNMITFDISKDLANNWGNSSIQGFIESCSDIFQSKKPNTPMLFYSWLDEMAGQLRVSAISKIHNKIPFDCKTNYCSLNHLVTMLMNTESGLYNKEKTLNVWCNDI